MRKTLAILGLATIACGAAVADQVGIKNFPYPNVQVVDVANCRITYEMAGNTLDKPIRDLTSINIDGLRDFNAAEDLMKAGKAAEAVVAYDKADKAETLKPWHKRLIRYRRLPALDAAKMTGRAVVDWLAIADENALARPAVMLAPVNLAAKGSPQNAQAMKLLEGRLKDAKDPTFISKLKQMLTDLYSAEGLEAKLAALNGAGGTTATEPAGGTGTGGTGEPATPTAGVGVVPSSAAMAEQLQSVANLIKAGQFEAAADSVKAKMRFYSVADLPNALMLRGRALLAAYDKSATKDPQMLLDAGLCFIRVASCCADQAPALAPEATFLAGQACQRLGNYTGAGNAYQRVSEDFGEKYPDWGKKATAALQALEKLKAAGLASAPAAAPAAAPASAPAAPAAGK
jgi:tetratricopeptide (TPR) repeat protein